MTFPCAAQDPHWRKGLFTISAHLPQFSSNGRSDMLSVFDV